MNYSVSVTKEKEHSYFHEFILMTSVAMSFAFIGSGELFGAINLGLMAYLMCSSGWRS